MTFTVAYWVHGRENGHWQKCLPVKTRAQADVMASKIVRGGRPAYVYETKALNVVGLPDDAPPLWDFENLTWKPHNARRNSHLGRA